MSKSGPASLQATADRLRRTRGLPEDGLSGQLVGKYRIEGRIAAGGFGEVFVVTSVGEGADERFALKRVGIPPKDEPDPGAWKRNAADRLLREAEFLRDHPHECLPRYVDQGLDEDGSPYLVMELLFGLAGDGFCGLPDESDEGAVREFVLDLLESVKAIHDAGFIHGDIKPTNVMRRPHNGRFLLVDFGTVHVIESEESSADLGPSMSIDANGVRHHVATRGYDAPETGHGISRDIYAVGRVIRDCFDKDVPLQWSAIINRCNSFNPRLRWSDVDEMIMVVKRIDEFVSDAVDVMMAQLRRKVLKRQSAISSRASEAMSWHRLPGDLCDTRILGRRYRIRGDELANYRPGRGEKYINLSQQVFRVPGRVELEIGDVVVVEGPGVLIVDLDAPENPRDGRSVCRNPYAQVFLLNGATLYNLSEKRPTDVAIQYIVGKTSLLTFAWGHSFGGNECLPVHSNHIVSAVGGYSTVLYGTKCVDILAAISRANHFGNPLRFGSPLRTRPGSLLRLFNEAIYKELGGDVMEWRQTSAGARPSRRALFGLPENR